MYEVDTGIRPYGRPSAERHQSKKLISLPYSLSVEIHTINPCKGGGQSGRSVWSVGEPFDGAMEKTGKKKIQESERV